MYHSFPLFLSLPTLQFYEAVIKATAVLNTVTVGGKGACQQERLLNMILYIKYT